MRSHIRPIGNPLFALPGLQSRGAQQQYQRIDDTIVQLFIRQVSVVMIPVYRFTRNSYKQG